MSGNAKLLKKIDKINPETDLVKDNQDVGPHHDPGDEEDDNPAVFQRPSTKAFLNQLEAKTGLDFDGDGQVGSGQIGTSGAGSRRPSAEKGSRPPSAAPLNQRGSTAGCKVEIPGGSDGIRLGKASPSSGRSSARDTKSPVGLQAAGSPFLSLATGASTGQLKNIQKQMGPQNVPEDVIHLDDDKKIEDMHNDSDEQDEGDGGSISESRADEKGEPIPIFPIPSAAETLAAAEAETESGGFNQHDPARALTNIQKMREVAKSKVAAAAQIGNMLDTAKELKISNEVLDSAIGKLNSDDWRTRKIAVYDVMDEVIVRSQKAREEGDADSMKYYCEKVEKHIIPVFCDENWWVRKAAIHGIVKLSKDDPTAVQDAVVGAIPESENYKGRWTAARSAIRMYDAAAAFDKAEDSMKTKIRLAMLELLADDHWIVRQEAVNAMKRFANFRDIDVISKAVSILPHPEAKVRQVAVTILNSFIDTDGQHDGMSNKQVAQKMMESGLVEQVSFEALDDNGNGRLSAKELRTGLKEMMNIVFSVPRIKTFLGEAANRDMKFQEFMDIVQKRFDDPVPEKSSLRDFYEEKQGLNKEEKDARKKWFRQNGTKMMTDIVNDIFNKLPVDYNLVPWVTRKMEVALRNERDWLCKDRLLEGYIKMVAFHDPYLPSVLCELLLDKHNSGKMCNKVATCVLDVAEVMGDDHLRKGEIGIFSHEWIDMPVSHEAMADRNQDRKEGTEGNLAAKARQAKIGRSHIEVLTWDICGSMVEKLYNPSVEMQLAAARCLVRFWDKGAATEALKEEAENLLKAVKKKEILLSVAKEEFKKELEQGDQKGARAGVNPALLRKKSRAPVKVATPRDDEYPPDIQSKIAALKNLCRDHERQVEKVQKSAKLDKLVLDGLKNARKSNNEELQQLAHQAIDILMANSKPAKATKSIKNAVKMVQALKDNMFAH